MLEKLVSTLLILGVFALPDSVFGQTETNNSVSNLRQIFAVETAKINSGAIDFNKLEREQMKSVSKSKWTKRQKTLLWVGIGAAIAATLIIVVVSQKDDDSDPRANCSATCTAVGCLPPPPCP
jgi:uncharacterized membrane protein YraQ (UPF0718 family)